MVAQSVSGISAKKARANRRNARKSTGPRTPQGKAASSQNATSHGIYCRHVVLDGEDQQRFDLLRNAYLHSLRPQDELELSFVDRIAEDQWKLDRLQAAEQRLYDFRRQEHQGLLERRRAGELGASPSLEKRWERVDKVLDPMAEPDFIAFCSALGSTSITMLSLLGDEQCLLERYEKHRRHLHLSISRALRELRLLRQPLKKGQSSLAPSPFSDERFGTEIESIANALQRLDEEEAELDELLGMNTDIEDEEIDDEDSDETGDVAVDISKTQNEPTATESTASPAMAKPCEPPVDQTSEPIVDQSTKNATPNILIAPLHPTQAEEPGGS